MELANFETVLIRGIFHFKGNSASDFKGPIRMGFRPIVWFNSIHKATSSSFIFDGQILEGESMEIDIAILNQQALDRKIVEGAILNVGSTQHTIGDFTVIKHLGLWGGGKIP